MNILSPIQTFLLCCKIMIGHHVWFCHWFHKISQKIIENCSKLISPTCFTSNYLPLNQKQFQFDVIDFNTLFFDTKAQETVIQSFFLHANEAIARYHRILNKIKKLNQLKQSKDKLISKNTQLVQLIQRNAPDGSFSASILTKNIEDCSTFLSPELSKIQQEAMKLSPMKDKKKKIDSDNKLDNLNSTISLLESQYHILLELIEKFKNVMKHQDLFWKWISPLSKDNSYPQESKPMLLNKAEELLMKMDDVALEIILSKDFSLEEYTTIQKKVFDDFNHLLQIHQIALKESPIFPTKGLVEPNNVLTHILQIPSSSMSSSIILETERNLPSNEILQNKIQEKFQDSIYQPIFHHS